MVVPDGVARELCEHPGVFLRGTRGTGRIIINQLLWEQQDYDAGRARRFASVLFTNLGVAMTAQSLVPVREKGWFLVDLASLCNGRLKNESGNDLRNLPTAVNEFRGVPFRVIPHAENGGMGSVRLGNVLRMEDGTVVAGGTVFPEEVVVPVGQRAGRLAFLHSAGFNHSLRRYAKSRICEYIVTYRGMGREIIPVRAKEEVRNWWTHAPTDLPNGKVAWAGPNEKTTSVAVYMSEWENPFPERIIDTITVRTCANPPWGANVIAISGTEIE